MIHYAGAFVGFHDKKRLGIIVLSSDGVLAHAGLRPPNPPPPNTPHPPSPRHPPLNLLIPIYTPE